MTGKQTGTLAAILCFALLSACSGDGNNRNEATSAPKSTVAVSPEPTQAATEKPAAGEDSGQSESGEPYAVIAENLRIPWSIAIAGNDFYVTEREGNIVRIGGGNQTRQNVRLSEAVLHEGEGGLLGFVLAPDFEESKEAFAYHTYEKDGKTLNRIVLLKQEGADWAEQQALLEGIPGNSTHNGGRLAIGPDGMLYATTGDAQGRSDAQDTNSLAGKIIRMTLTGQIPSDNPFPNSYVYSYGHRNPQGIAWTEDGQMYSTEHGPSGNPGGHDEINVIAPGNNYGWSAIYGDQKKQDMVTPIYHTGDPAIAPSGTIVDGEGRLVIATLRGEAIYRYTPATGKMEVIHEGEGRIRDLKLVQDKLYFVTNNLDGRGGKSSESEDRLVRMDYPE
ncbi:PQQ-dependent sugar dehydrogenase [Paenibacillus sp. LHD-117]|uniref:PQQ-dependent sugar dehydrogenase n=1 Tax=Paenibacillus sp. LHD-117 TaxID=3071412 RepID=UPI0027E203FC|nr:PQQ-dependent sugar dehydrogenase [Paenibacillus sp. LHD-117]MDQ6423572.1 PQQ-dependent sugar dehydrogenase [Paenibacillus sp. LHD-117]